MINIRRLEYTIANSGCPMDIILFARNIRGANIDMLTDVLLQRTKVSIYSEAAFIFYTSVFGAKLYKLEPAIRKQLYWSRTLDRVLLGYNII